MSGGFARGFENVKAETPPCELPVTGSLPDWLHGALLRTGPGVFSLASESYRHWFDGLAMLHRFGFRAGRPGSIGYTSRFLRSPDHERSTATGRVSYDGFATVPRRGPIDRLRTLIDPARQFGRNGMVNVQRLGPRSYIAMTENPLAMEFDPDDLSTLGPFDYQDSWSGAMDMITTAHAQADLSRRALYNFVARLDPLNPRYIVNRIDEGSRGRVVVGEVPTDAIAYMHGFGMTERYIILVEYPLVTTPAALFLMPLTGRTYIENYAWKPERGARFRVIDKRDGSNVGAWETDAFFAFHHVNAREVGDELHVDLSVYADGVDILGQFYLDRLRSPSGGTIAWSGLERFRLPLRGDRPVRRERICDAMFEMPQINSARCSAGAYRYAYGVSYTAPGRFVDALVKIDVERGDSRSWHEDGCHPGEPVFVPRPGGADEDDGVNLSVVFDSRAGASFLLVLDSASFTERARVALPHAIPFMLHGQFDPGGAA
ncbi:MAG: carotenoid oxygenase family protein [Myxococcaceae bacterium]|nr:MAG: carotenoid oxygenase family protein [Myxococcaceae bacterium]